MADSTAIALVSVVVAGVASLGAPLVAGWVAGRQLQQQLAHERALRETEEMRQRLDEMAAAIDAANRAVGRAYGTLLQQGPTSDPLRERVSETFRQVHDARLVLVRLATRLETTEHAVQEAQSSIDADDAALLEIDTQRALGRFADEASSEWIDAHQEQAARSAVRFLAGARRFAGISP